MQAERFFLKLPTGLEHNPLLSTTFASAKQLSSALGCDETQLRSVLAPVGEDAFLSATLPWFQRLVREETVSLFPTGQLELLTGSEQQVHLSKRQCAWLLGSLFFSLFDGQHAATKPAYPPSRFFNIYSLNLLWRRDMRAPLTCIANYMSRVSQGACSQTPVIISRYTLPKDYQIDGSKRLRHVHVLPTTPIEDCVAPLHADFANKFPGGGALDGGCVQEEILFVIKPECLISMLLVEVLDERSAFFIEGAERFSSYAGYGHTWRFAGDFAEKQPAERCVIVGIDASVNRGGLEVQFSEAGFMRDIYKCIAGLNPYAGQTFATGGWGTGAFGCDKHIKALQQIVAASAVGCDVIYTTFGDKELAAAIDRFMEAFRDSTVGEVLELFRRRRDGDYIGKNALLNELIRMKQ